MKFMGILDGSQYQAKLVNPCPEHPVWIYVICFLAVSDLKTTIGAILAQNCTGKRGPSFLKFNLGTVIKSLLEEVNLSVCEYTSDPALHLAGWDLGKSKIHQPIPWNGISRQQTPRHSQD